MSLEHLPQLIQRVAHIKQKTAKKRINDAIGHYLAAFHPSFELTALYWCWLSCTHRPLETAIKYTSYKSWIVMVYQTIYTCKIKQAQPYQQKPLASCTHMFDWSNESRLEIITWHHTRTRDPESCKIWEALSLQLSTPSPSEPVICHQLARFPRALDLWMSLCHLCLVQCYSIRQARGASVAVSWWIFLMFDDVWCHTVMTWKNWCNYVTSPLKRTLPVLRSSPVPQLLSRSFSTFSVLLHADLALSKPSSSSSAPTPGSDCNAWW